MSSEFFLSLLLSVRVVYYSSTQKIEWHFFEIFPCPAIYCLRFNISLAATVIPTRKLVWMFFFFLFECETIFFSRLTVVNKFWRNSYLCVSPENSMDVLSFALFSTKKFEMFFFSKCVCFSLSPTHFQKKNKRCQPWMIRSAVFAF